MTRRALGLFLLASAAAFGAGTPRPAQADSAQTQSFAVWGRMDKCAQQANTKFPDHTPDGNAKREAARLDCLRANHLPVSATAPH